VGVRSWMGFGSGKNRVQVTGLSGEATILSLREGGPYVNDQPTLTIELDVELPGRQRYRAQARQRVARLVIGRLELGATIPVRVDPDDLASVFVDESVMLGHAAGAPQQRLPEGSASRSMLEVLENGQPARARIRKMRTNNLVASPQGDLIIKFVLELTGADGEPYKAKVALRTPEAAPHRLGVGHEVPVRVAADNPKAVAIDWVQAGLASPEWVRDEKPLPPPIQPAAAGDVPIEQGDQLEKLERLARLRDSGALTEEEFTAKKAEILQRF
jgi:putative oligomerization/nucleic acid binding protein